MFRSPFLVIALAAATNFDGVFSAAAAVVPYVANAATGATPVAGAKNSSSLFGGAAANAGLWADGKAAAIAKAIEAAANATTLAAYTPRMYIGSVVDSKATFGQCTYKATADTVVDLCQCSSFTYDPTGIKIRLDASASLPVFVQPLNCATNSTSAGVTCSAATQADATGGCGPFVAGKSAGHELRENASLLLVLVTAIGYLSA